MSTAKCFHCNELLRTYKTIEGLTIERSVFRTKFAENGDYTEMSVHPRCAKFMYGKFYVVKHILQSKKDYPVRPNAKFLQRVVKIELDPVDHSKEMDVAEMVGMATEPVSDDHPEGFEKMFAFHCAKGQMWPGRHHALKNNEAIKTGEKAKKTYVPEALEDAVDRGDVTRLVKARLEAHPPKPTKTFDE